MAVLSAIVAIPKIAEYVEKLGIAIMTVFARKKAKDRLNRITETGIKYRAAETQEEVDDALKEYQSIITRR